LDIIAENPGKKMKLGIEVKNMLYLMPKNEINRKFEICKTLGLTPVFACRWIEPYREEIASKGGFAWQFKDQLYPFGQEEFVDIIKKRFHFPLRVTGEIPVKAVKSLENWLNSYKVIS